MLTSDSQRDVILDTLAYALVDRLLLHCALPTPPSDADWNRWIEQSCQPDHDAVLVTGSKEAAFPNSMQRASLINALDSGKHRHVPVAIVVHSSLQRGVFKVFRWLSAERATVLRAFPPDALDEALAWLGVTARREDVEHAIVRLQSATARPGKTAGAR